jgi:hypothetical protein
MLGKILTAKERRERKKFQPLEIILPILGTAPPPSNSGRRGYESERAASKTGED